MSVLAPGSAKLIVDIGDLSLKLPDRALLLLQPFLGAPHLRIKVPDFLWQTSCTTIRRCSMALPYEKAARCWRSISPATDRQEHMSPGHNPQLEAQAYMQTIMGQHC